MEYHVILDRIITTIHCKLEFCALIPHDMLVIPMENFAFSCFYPTVSQLTHHNIHHLFCIGFFWSTSCWQPSVILISYITVRFYCQWCEFSWKNNTTSVLTSIICFHNLFKIWTTFFFFNFSKLFKTFISSNVWLQIIDVCIVIINFEWYQCC